MLFVVVVALVVMRCWVECSVVRVTFYGVALPIRYSVIVHFVVTVFCCSCCSLTVDL
jgi:hypothetical protein